MYKTHTVAKVTEEDILKKTTEYDIYNYYMPGKFEIGRAMTSPFRKDNNPSFSIFKAKKNGKLLFKDHATGDTGDCFKFVMQIENLTYKKALQYIFKNIIANQLKQTTKGVDIKERYKNTSKIISIKKKYFTTTDDNYWGKYKVINRNLLKFFNVYPISNVWLNDQQMAWKYTENNPMYAYEIYNKYKIYRPCADKKHKFLSNCGLYDIQGWEQLSKRDNKVIITKSLKDVMVLHALGYDAVAPQGEHSGLPKKIIDQLQYWYDEIYILYDNDRAGMKGSLNITDKYPFIKAVFLPSIEKDISDYIENHTIEQTKNILNELWD